MNEQDRIDKMVFAVMDAKNTKKTCGSCKKIHTRVPDNARFSSDPDMGGFYWECSCKSTLFVHVACDEKVAA